MANQTELERIMWVKHALVTTTGTPGWPAVKQIAENALQAMTEKMLAEEDDTKGSNLRREVKAARTFMNTLFKAIEAAKQIVPDEDDGMAVFGDLGSDFQAAQGEN